MKNFKYTRLNALRIEDNVLIYDTRSLKITIEIETLDCLSRLQYKALSVISWETGESIELIIEFINESVNLGYQKISALGKYALQRDFGKDANTDRWFILNRSTFPGKGYPVIKPCIIAPEGDVMLELPFKEITWKEHNGEPAWENWIPEEIPFEGKLLVEKRRYHNGGRNYEEVINVYDENYKFIEYIQED
jgi:hypothetical protein